jgi:hypothetical protein
MKLAPAPANSRGGGGSNPRVKNVTRTRRVRYPHPRIKLPSLVDVSTRDRVSLNPKPLRMTTKVNLVLHYQSLQRGEQYKLPETQSQT